MTSTMAFSVRLVALVVATISGISFLMLSGSLLWLTYEMPGHVQQADLVTTIVLGTLFCSSGAVYMFLVRRSKRAEKANQSGRQGTSA